MAEDNVIQWPIRPFIRRPVSVQEMYAEPEPTDTMIWAICPYLRGSQADDRCMGCPKTEILPDAPEWGEVTRGCRVMASEACRFVTAAQKKG